MILNVMGVQKIKEESQHLMEMKTCRFTTDIVSAPCSHYSSINCHIKNVFISN